MAVILHRFFDQAFDAVVNRSPSLDQAVGLFSVSLGASQKLDRFT